MFYQYTCIISILSDRGLHVIMCRINIAWHGRRWINEHLNVALMSRYMESLGKVGLRLTFRIFYLCKYVCLRGCGSVTANLRCIE